MNKDIRTCKHLPELDGSQLYSFRDYLRGNSFYKRFLNASKPLRCAKQRQGTVLCLNGNNQDRGRFSVLTKGIRYAILKQGDVICQEEHESNQKPAFIM